MEASLYYIFWRALSLSIILCRRRSIMDTFLLRVSSRVSLRISFKFWLVFGFCFKNCISNTGWKSLVTRWPQVELLKFCLNIHYGTTIKYHGHFFIESELSIKFMLQKILLDVARLYTTIKYNYKRVYVPTNSLITVLYINTSNMIKYYLEQTKFNMSENLNWTTIKKQLQTCLCSNQFTDNSNIYDYQN